MKKKTTCIAEHQLPESFQDLEPYFVWSAVENFGQPSVVEGYDVARFVQFHE